MIGNDKIIGISVNYVKYAVDADKGDISYNLFFSIEKPEVKEALKVLGVVAPQSIHAPDTRKPVQVN